jgi:hypothetical protein
MHLDNEGARLGRRPIPSRAGIAWISGLDRISTFVLKATGDMAMALSNGRLTLDQVEELLATATRISRRKIEASLGPLCDQGYLTADDAPGNPEIVLHLTEKGMAAYCRQLVAGFGRIEKEILLAACTETGIDAYDISRRTGQAEMLVEYVLRDAQGNGHLRLEGSGHYLVVRDVSPQLRRWISGAA